MKQNDKKNMGTTIQKRENTRKRKPIPNIPNLRRTRRNQNHERIMGIPILMRQNNIPSKRQISLRKYKQSTHGETNMNGKNASTTKSNTQPIK